MVYGVTKYGEVAVVGSSYYVADGAPGVGYYDYDDAESGFFDTWKESDFVALFENESEAQAEAARIVEIIRVERENQQRAEVARLTGQMAKTLVRPFRVEVDEPTGCFLVRVTLPDGEWTHDVNELIYPFQARTYTTALNAGFFPREQSPAVVERDRAGRWIARLTRYDLRGKVVPIAREMVSRLQRDRDARVLIAEKRGLVRAFPTGV